MPRTTKSLTAKAKHKKLLSRTKGFYGARMQYAFRDRKNRKRGFRSLWISRINAGSRHLGISYSKLVNSLDRKNIIINRKVLSEIAVSDESTFKKIVETAVN